MVYAESNARVAETTTKLFLSIAPESMHPGAREVVYALCDERLRKAFGFPNPQPMVQFIAHSALWLKGAFIRHCLLPRPLMFGDRRTPMKATAATCPFDISQQRFEQVYDIYGHSFDYYIIPKVGPENPAFPK